MANEELREQNYNKVLETGLLMFYKYGIENSRIKILSEESGISVRSISRYFSTKEEFVIAVVEHYIKKQDALIRSLLVGNLDENSCGLEKLKQFLTMLKTIMIDQPQMFLMLADCELFLSHHNDHKTVIEGQILGFCNMARKIREYLDKGIKDGSITKITQSYMESKVICQSFISLMMQMALTQKMNQYSMEACNKFLSCYINQIIRSLN